MSHPCAVMPFHDLTLLVGANLFQGGFVRFRVVLYRDLCRHAADGMRPAPVTTLDQKDGICVETPGHHTDPGAVRQDELGMEAKLLDDTEDIVPPSAVES